MTFEDFVPYSDTEALISSGKRIAALHEIESTCYSIGEGGLVKLGPRIRTLASGQHLRLGGYCNGQLLYSDAFRVVGAEAPEGAHQPFMHRGRLYYTAEWPGVTIHCDGRRYLGHFDGMVQVGNPHWSGDTMYFEARDTMVPTAVDAWQVWKQVEGGEPEYVCHGANPACYGGFLFYGKWNGERFDYYRRPE